jgi:hypothetical protein
LCKCPFPVAHYLTYDYFKGICGSCPTAQPSDLPSSGPTLVPSIQPSREPSVMPSFSPTRLPTVSPSEYPTTSQPSLSPTVSPTGLPTAVPTVSSVPSSQPTGLLENCEPIVPCGDESVLFCLDAFNASAPVTLCLCKYFWNPRAPLSPELHLLTFS